MLNAKQFVQTDIDLIDFFPINDWNRGEKTSTPPGATTFFFYYAFFLNISVIVKAFCVQP